MNKATELGGDMLTNAKAFDAYKVYADEKRSYFVQAKSGLSPASVMSQVALNKWVAHAKSESRRLIGKTTDVSEFLESNDRIVIIMMAERFARNVSGEWLSGFRLDNRTVTILFFEMGENRKYHVPLDDWTWNYVVEQMKRSPRMRADVENIRRDCKRLDEDVDALYALPLPPLPPTLPQPERERPSATETVGTRKRRQLEHTDGSVYCHESAGSSRISPLDAVKCTTCKAWYSAAKVAKFGDDVESVRKNRAWSCYHCRGTCSLCSCVKRREGNKTAREIETLLKGVTSESYFRLIMRAKAERFDNVLGWVKHHHPGLDWTSDTLSFSRAP